MKKSMFFLLMVALFMGGLQAKPVDVETAKALGIKFMKANTEIRADVAQLVYTGYTEQGVACFYVFSMQPKGFVIVSADNRAKPILGYSTEGAFSEALPEGVESFFRNYRAGFTDLFASGDSRSAEAASDWERLAATGKINNDRITRTVPKLLTCTWNQSALYDRRCPEDTLGPDGHVYAGCVATAMSQIMYYWQWPRVGRGAQIYEIWEYGQIAASFESAVYRYDLMPDFLDWTSTDAEIDAVALLQYHAGVSVEMGYSPDGSGAFSQSVPGAMTEHFIYDEHMNLDYRDWHQDAEWNTMLRENLDGGMPLYYSASGNDGGHAFVCDGYDDNNMFHFNWGWQGLDNGYYAINGFYLSHYSFPEGHSAIFGIIPDSYPHIFCPEGVKDFQVQAVAEGTNRISFIAPSMVVGGDWNIDLVDSIIFVRNDEIIHTEYNVAAGAQISYNDENALGISHYCVYPFAGEYPGPMVKDTILNGPTCTLNFHLHDSVGDGWIAPAISIVDSRGNAVARVGLSEGSDDIVKVEVPSFDDVKIHWAYTIGGKDGECYFEVYNWDGCLIYATDDKPEIGELCSVYVDCSDDVAENEEETISIYPNPTRSQIVIEGVEVAKVEVYNTLGQRVMTSRQQVIDLSELEAGMYFVRIVDESDAVSTVKFLKR